MQLSTFLDVNGITQTQFAAEFGVSLNTASRWARRLMVPAPKKMLQIYLWTHGAVTPNDFYDLPDLTQGGLDALQARSHPADPSSLPALQDGAAGPGGDAPTSPPTPLLSAIGVAA